MVSVIFPAAGQGRRMGLGFNKIFTELAGKPILIQTLLTFPAATVLTNSLSPST